MSDDGFVDELIDNGGRRDALDIHKSWQAIHFVLTGDPWGGDPPLANVVLGGQEVGEDLGYGPARLLKPDEVTAVSRELESIDDKKFSEMYRNVNFSGADVYAYSSETQGDKVLGELLHYFRAIRTFFKNAAAKGDGMLLYLI